MCHEQHKIRIYASKENTPYIYAHPSQHTHAHHAHDYTYPHVYTCTHCRHTEHLTKFYYDRIHNSNSANKCAWVRKYVNPHRPKKVWVPKFTLIVFDVGVDSHKMCEYRYLDGVCVRAT